MNIRITLFLSILFIIGSCTFEKRLYSKGFHVESRKKLRESDSNDAHTIQPAVETPETGAVMIDSNSRADVPILREKEEAEIPVIKANIRETIPVFQSVSGKSKMNPAVNSHSRKVFIQTHFSESVMGKSLRENRNNHSEKKSRNFDWEEFWKWMLIIGLTLGAVFLISLAPGISFLQAFIVVFAAILALYLFVLLLSAAFGNFEWFWIGN